MEHGLEVVGGDFNTRRCRAPLETSRCRALPFWRALAEHGYADAVYERHASSPLSLVAHSRRGAHVLPRIDFLFVRGRILDAASDRNYDARATDPGFYSDHRLVWAVVASRP